MSFMASRRYNRWIALSLLVMSATALGAPNAVEQKWKTLLDQGALKKEVVMLKSGKSSFLALYRSQRSGIPQGGVILLHPRGEHPDWQYVIAPLRKALPRYGWSTLSLQLPVLDDEAKLDDYAKLFDPGVDRILAGINYLQSHKIRNIVIIGYDLGATLGAYALTKKPGPYIKAFVGISMISTRDNKILDTSLNLALVKTPVFDIYASNDTQFVSAALVERIPLTYKHRRFKSDERDPKSARYRQWEVIGADHRYTGYERVLIKRIRSWLKVFAPGKTIEDKKANN